MGEIDKSRKDLVEAFRAQPIGRHGPELRDLLNRMRQAPGVPDYILICTQPHREWLLATKAPARGAPVELVQGYRFTSPEEAEWCVFKLRWKALTGEELA